MATITTKFGSGGAGLTPAKSAARDTGTDPSLALALREIADDFTELRTQFIALLAKIDADSGDTGGDSNYEATLTPAALKTIKG